MKSDLYLAYVDYIGVNALGYYEYDVFLTDSPDTVWGEDWEQQCPSACGETRGDNIYTGKKIAMLRGVIHCAGKQLLLSTGLYRRMHINVLVNGQR